MDKLKSIYASAYSATITIVAVVAMTIGAELSAPFKSWLASFTGHHWVTKSWASIIIFGLTFALIYALAKNADQVRTRQALIILQIMAVVGFAAILGFYIYEVFAP